MKVPEEPLVCPDCDLLLHPEPVEPGQKLVCPCCNKTLLAPVDGTVEKTLALALTGLILFWPGIFMPLLTIDVIGLSSSGSIFESSTALVEGGFVFTGIAVFLTAVLIPFMKLAMLAAVSLQLLMRAANRWTVFMLRAYRHLDEWGMLEVYMIGILVTIIKLLHMAKIQYDVGFYCFIGLMMATLLSSSFLDEHHYWEEMDRQLTRREAKELDPLPGAADPTGEFDIGGHHELGPKEAQG